MFSAVCAPRSALGVSFVLVSDGSFGVVLVLVLWAVLGGVEVEGEGEGKEEEVMGEGIVPLSCPDPFEGGDDVSVFMDSYL